MRRNSKEKNKTPLSQQEEQKNPKRRVYEGAACARERGDGGRGLRVGAVVEPPQPPIQEEATRAHRGLRAASLFTVSCERAREREKKEKEAWLFCDEEKETNLEMDGYTSCPKYREKGDAVLGEYASARRSALAKSESRGSRSSSPARSA